jgi:cytochrome c-type biogenesis protein CcmH/NrfG
MRQTNRRAKVARTGALALCCALAASGCKRADDRRPQPGAAPAGGAPMPGAPMPGAPMPGGALPGGKPEPQVRIQQLEKVVAAEPKSLGAWIELGNLYFDTRQPQRAVDAYSKALELDPTNADVLTDQGVMYRELGEPRKAIENFEKARKANPKHLQSLFNMGVVQLTDLKDPKQAIATWERLIQEAPDSHHAHDAKRAIDSARQAPAAPK